MSCSRLIISLMSRLHNGKARRRLNVKAVDLAVQKENADSFDWEDAMKSSAIYAVPIGVAVALLTIPVSKCKMSSEVRATDTKVIQVLAMGDIRGHQLRIYEIHHVYPNAKPN